MISIIIPVYNVAPFITGCLTSIQHQTVPDFEVICINDGSTDDSGRLLDEFAAQDPRFHVIHQENKGQAAARNAGLNQVKGDFILFVDSDDYIHPQTLELLLRAQHETNADVVGGGITKTTTLYNDCSFSEITDCPYQVFDEPLAAYMNRRDVMTSVFRLYRRDVLSNIRFVEGIYFEDVPFTTMVMASIRRLAQVTLPLYYYYLSPQSTMRGSFNLKKVNSYPVLIRAINTFIREHKPDALPQVRRTILNGRFKMMVNQAVRKQPDPKLQKELFAAILPITNDLYRAGMISYAGLKPKHRLCLWLLTHQCPNLARLSIRFIP